MEYLLRISTGRDIPFQVAERLEIRSKEMNLTAEALISKLIGDGLDALDEKVPNRDLQPKGAQP